MPRFDHRWRRAGAWLLDAALPPVCPGCEAAVPGWRWICGDCRRILRPAPPQPLCWICRTRDRPDGDREAGFHCLDPEHAPSRGSARFWMEDPLDRFIHALKFQGREDLARPLGRALARSFPIPPGDALVVAVPLSRVRRRERGYNQAGALANEAARNWGLPRVRGLLSRVRSTVPQSDLDHDRRRANVAGAFRVREPAWVRGRTWLLVDDVVTTGETLRAASQALSGEGAARVIPVALAVA